MQTITLESIEAKQTELRLLIAKFKAQPATPATTTWVFHEVSIELQPGERYAGPVLDESGNLMHHLVVMAQRPTDKLNWQAAMDWATRQDDKFQAFRLQLLGAPRRGRGRPSKSQGAAA